MDRVNLRKQIEILFVSGKKPDEIREILVRKHGSKGPCRATVYNWIRQVKRNDEALEDHPRSGAPKRAATSSNIEKVLEAVTHEPKLSIRMLESEIGISKETIRKILHQELDMQKMNCTWIPKELNASQKKARVESCRKNLNEWTDRWDELIEWMKHGSNMKIPNQELLVLSGEFVVLGHQKSRSSHRIVAR